MKLLPQQVKAAGELRRILKKYGVALLAGETRSGKTLTFLDVCKDYKRPLIITQKSAVGDIKRQGGVDVINFYGTAKLKADYDFIVIDEFHKYIGGYPKRSQIWHWIRALSAGVPIIFSSGTPTPEGYANLFNAFALSDWSPWRDYSRFTLWHKIYGRPYSIRINGIDIQKYDRIRKGLIELDIRPITAAIKRNHTFEAVDKPVQIEMSRKQKKFYKLLERDLIYKDVLADTPAKLMQKLHQISGGFVKTEDGGLYTFRKNPKIEWLQANIDPDNTIILANYIAEQQALAEVFPHTGSVRKMAEGVDLSHFKVMVIYSMSFSAAGYQQVRARQMNIHRREPIEIIYLITGIDEYVYKAVQAKRSFTAGWFKRERGTTSNTGIPIGGG